MSPRALSDIPGLWGHGHGTIGGKSLGLGARGCPVPAGGGGGGAGAIPGVSHWTRWDRDTTGAPGCLGRGVPAPETCPCPTAVSLPHSSVPLPLDECPCPKMDHCCRQCPAAPRGCARPQWEPPNSRGPDMSLLPIHWGWLGDQHMSPRSLTPSPGPSAQPAPSVLGQEQKPRPWAAGAEQGEASPAWPWASSSLALNYSESGSACGVCSGHTPANGRNRWLFNSSWPEGSWLCCSGSCPPRRL